VVAREAKLKVLVAERAIAKSDRPVEKYGDVDHQLKKVRSSSMQAHAEKIMVDTISTQIKNLKENADVYKSVHGEKAYNELLLSLISKMTGTMSKKGTTPSSARSEDNDDGEWRGRTLWTVDGQNPAIEIGNALKRKTGIPPLTRGAIMIASWTRRPVHMNYIH